MSSDSPEPPNNGAILTRAQIIKALMYSTAEAKLGALYINCKEEIPAQHALEEIVNKKNPTLMQTKNTTALGVIKKM